MSSMKNQTTIYQFSGNIRNLQFSVELCFNGMSFGNVPNYEQFAMQCLPPNTTLDGTSVRPQTSASRQPASCSLVDIDSSEEFAIVDECKIAWQEKIERPTGQRRERLERVTTPTIPEDPSQTSELVVATMTDENSSTNVLTEIRAPKRHSRIFTYIDNELSTNKISDSGTLLFKRRREAPLRPISLEDTVSCDLSYEQRLKRRDIRNAHSSMLIMAYMGNFDEFGEANPADEHVLCRITEINGRILKVTPDFGTFLLKTRSGTYTVTIRVETQFTFDTITERRDIGEDDELASNSGEYKFELPDSNIYWIHYFITIEEAIDFPHENVFVEYHIELPSNIQALGQSALRGRTESCYVVEDGCHDIARFSFPIELTVCYPMWSRQPNELVIWPRIMFRVVSEDYWRRFFVSGYGTAHLPALPGKHEMSVKCWRVENTYSHFAALRDFFLGQSIDLKSIEFIGCKGSNNEWTKIYSKVGLQTISSGTLRISTQCVHHSRQYISRDMMRFIRYGMLMDRIGMNSTMHWRIMKVLHDFDVARKQLLRLRSTEKPLMKYSVL